MKIIVISDLHGATKSLKKFLPVLTNENPDSIWILGDILQGGYEGGAMECARLLAPWKNKILAVRGNCDLAEDERLLGFPLPEHRSFKLLDYEVQLAHRPLYCYFPEKHLIATGHTHRKTLYLDQGVVYLNPGSLGYPRDHVASYAVIDGRTITLRSLEDGAVLETLVL